jgi:hydrogenase maturation protein HypF
MRGSVEIRVRGRVQGVGFRPTVWRHARALALDGEVLNDSEGVLVRVSGAPSQIEALIEALHRQPPPLARIDGIELSDCAGAILPGFRIAESVNGAAHTQIAPDPRCVPLVLRKCATRCCGATAILSPTARIAGQG